MALQAQTVTASLAAGLDLKTDKKAVASTSLLTAQNVRFPSISAARKRYGQSLAPNGTLTGGQITSGRAIGAFGNETLLYDGGALYGFSPSAALWEARANLTEIVADVQNITAGVNSALDVVSASNATTELYVWSDTNGNVYFSSRDAVAGTMFAQNVLLAPAAYGPQICYDGTNFWVLTVGSMTGQITIWQLPGFAPQASGTNTLIGTTILGSYPSLQYNTTQSLIQIGWYPSAGMFNLTSYQGTTFFVTQTAAITGIAAGARSAIAPIVYTQSGANFVAVVTQPGVFTGAALVFADASPSYSLTAGAFTLPQPAGVAAGYTIDYAGVTLATLGSGNQVFFVTCGATSSTGLSFTYAVSAQLPGVGYYITAPVYGLLPTHNPTYTGGQFYWLNRSPLTINGAVSQNVSFYLLSLKGTLVDLALLSTNVTVARPTIVQHLLNGLAGLNFGSAPQLTVRANGSIFTGLSYRAQLRADATGTVYSAAYITSVRFAVPAVSQLQVLSFGNTALINCGNMYSYDGYNVVEQGFWEFPEGVTAMAGGPGTGQLNTLGFSPGQYQVFACFEWSDAQGNRTYSAPSYPVYVNTGLNDSITVTFPYTALTLKQNAVVGIYITTVNASSPAYKVAELANITNGTLTGSYTITTSDLQNSGGLRLYAPADFSGEIENDPAPPFKYMFATKTRVFGIPQDAPYQLWYSKPMATGRPAEFSSAQVIVIEQQGGAVTGLAAVDTQAVIFKAERIYTLPGDGPNAGGQPANAFPQTLQLLSSTTGCISNPSILATSDGLFFQSKTGLSQLNRSISVDATFGMPVQPLGQSLSFTGALAVPAQNQLRWTSSQGTCLVYDYVTQRWSTYTNYDAVGYAPFNTTYARLRTDGRVWFEDQTTYLDNGAVVTMTIETAWYKPASMAQGYAAVWYAEILGEYIDSHQLSIEVAYNYLDFPAQTSTWNASAAAAQLGTYGSYSPYGKGYWGGGTVQVFGTLYQLRLALQRQVCQALKFKIYDSSITGASCTLSEIALQLGVIDGLNRVPMATQQV